MAVLKSRDPISAVALSGNQLPGAGNDASERRNGAASNSAFVCSVRQPACKAGAPPSRYARSFRGRADLLIATFSFYSASVDASIRPRAHS
jgi:hypothetical protein